MNRIEAGYIYCIGSYECPCARVKIGKSSDPFSRLEQFKTGSPCQLELKWTIEVQDMNEAEKVIHRELKQWCIRREWFSVPEPVVERLYSRLTLCKGNFESAVRSAVNPGEEDGFVQQLFQLQLCDDNENTA